jgi:hypothetical protein
MQERRQSVSLSNDLLLQILEHQQDNAKLLGEVKSSIEGLSGPQGRVTALEHGQTRNFWLTMAITPLIGILHAITRKLGI